MKGRPIPYSLTEMRWLRANRTLVISEYHARFCAKFGRPDVSPAHLHALRKRSGWKTGRSGCFAPGLTPHNKGKKMPYHPNSARTRFQRGNLPHNYRGVGHEFLDPKDGYLYTIIHDDKARTKTKTRRVLKHKLLWELANGAVPAGCALKCLDGNKQNTAPSNWALISRALLPRLNGGRHKSRIAFDDAPTELKPTIMALAKLEDRIRDRR